MSKFLYSRGLNRLVENIKSKFQKKPYVVDVSVDVNSNGQTGTVSIQDPERILYPYLQNKESNYNIIFRVYINYSEQIYECKDANISFIDPHYLINIDFPLFSSEDDTQAIAHISLKIGENNTDFKGYYHQQLVEYNNNVLLTGTGVAIKPERYFINFEDRAFYLINDNGIGLGKSFSFDKAEDMQVMFNKFFKYTLGSLLTPMSFAITDANLINSAEANFIVTNISQNFEGDAIEVTFFINDFNTEGYDTDTMNIRKYSLVILKDGTLDDFMLNSVSISLSSIEVAVDAAHTIYTGGSGTKFLADDGEYKEIKGYDKVYYKNPKEFLLSNTEESRQAASNIWKLLINNKLCCFIDPADKSLYNVSLDVGIDYEDEGGIFKIYNNDITYIFDILDTTKLLEEYDNSYNGNAWVVYVVGAYHMQAFIDDVYNNVIGDIVYGSPLKIFNIDTGLAKFTTIGKYKIIYRAVISGSNADNIYVGDLIVEAPDSNNPNKRKYTIKRVAGSDYYFTIAQQPILGDDEYTNLSYHDIILVDINDNTEYYNKHVIEHNPHKNDDVIIITDDNGYLPYTTKNNVGFCKIVKEYFEGVRRYGISGSTGSIYPTINYTGAVTNASIINENINGFYEDVTVLVDKYTNDKYDGKAGNVASIYGILYDYIYEYYHDGLTINDTPHKKTIRFINNDNQSISLFLIQNGLIQNDQLDYDEIIGFDENNLTKACQLVLRPYETCEVIIIIGSIYEENVNVADIEFLRNEMHIIINRINNKGNLLTLSAESGTIDEIQAWIVNYAYVKNEPLYVLYSGIKMLVNSIQKLGDMWSLSCSHEGVVYSVTVDTAEMSYNVITNV